MLGMERNDNTTFPFLQVGETAFLSFPWDLNSLGEDAWAVVSLGVFHLGLPSVQAFCRDLTQETCPAFGTPQLSRPGTSTLRSWGWVQWGSLLTGGPAFKLCDRNEAGLSPSKGLQKGRSKSEAAGAAQFG